MTQTAINPTTGEPMDSHAELTTADIAHEKGEDAAAQLIESS